MSVYRPKDSSGKPKSPHWHYDFQIRTATGDRRRFHGSTGETSKAKAIAFEERERARVKSASPNDPMTLAEAAFRYCDEVAAHQPSAADTERAFEHCARLIGGHRRLASITGDDIADAARRRSGETYGKVHPKFVSRATVNRQITEPMRRLMRRARRVWGVSCDPESIDWSKILLREPTERVREFSAAEAAAFWSELRHDYLPLVWFLAHRGFRVRAVLAMTKADVDLDGKRVRIWQKGKGLVWLPITAEQAAVIQTEMARSPRTAVWTYETQRKRPARGIRVPITYYALRRQMQTTLKRAKISDFRIHDLRHDFASKLLRATRDLALVRKTLGHADIQSTMRYAHVLDEDVIAGMETLERTAARPTTIEDKDATTPHRTSEVRHS